MRRINRSRPAALAALFALAFASLLPLLASARMLVAEFNQFHFACGGGICRPP